MFQSKVQNVDEKLKECKTKLQRNSFIFELMLRLKQICNHPANFHHDCKRDIESSGKVILYISSSQHASGGKKPQL